MTTIMINLTEENPFLRICCVCGYKAFTIEDLTKFVTDKTRDYGYRNLCKKCQRDKYIKNREKILKKQNKYYKDNRENCLKSKKIYYEENKDEISKFRRNKYKEKPEEYLIRNMKDREKIRFNALKYLSDPPQCKNCGVNNFLVLTIDHINNDGNEERKTIRPNKLWEIIPTMPKEEALKKYQVLCRNCNWEKKLKNSWLRKYL